MVLRNVSYFFAHKLFLSVAQVCHRFFNLLVNKPQGVEVVEVGKFKYLGSTIKKKLLCTREVKKKVQAEWSEAFYIFFLLFFFYSKISSMTESCSRLCHLF